MMRQTLMMTLLFAAVAMTAVADVAPMHDTSYPRYIYHYHAVPQSVFNEWQEHRKLVNAESTDSDWHTWLEERENTAWNECTTIVRGALEKYAFEIVNFGLIVLVALLVFVVFLLCRRRYKAVLLSFLFGVVVFIGVLFFERMWSNQLLVAANLGGVITETVNVKPNDGESYDQYQTRVYRKGHNLCEVCGAELERWYDMGRHWGCRKCWEEGKAKRKEQEWIDTTERWIKTDEETDN